MDTSSNWPDILPLMGGAAACAIVALLAARLLNLHRLSFVRRAAGAPSAWTVLGMIPLGVSLAAMLGAFGAQRLLEPIVASAVNASLLVGLVMAGALSGRSRTVSGAARMHGADRSDHRAAA